MMFVGQTSIAANFFGQEESPHSPPALREYELHNPHIDETQEHDGAVDNQPHVVAVESLLPSIQPTSFTQHPSPIDGLSAPSYTTPPPTIPPCTTLHPLSVC